MTIKEELHRKEIDHMRRKLADGSRGSYTTAPTETNRFFANENVLTQRATSRPRRGGKSAGRDVAAKIGKGAGEDGVPPYSFGGAYVNILNDEF